MSVLIKNIEMPENCYECLLQGSRGVCLATGGEVESKQFECRPEWCPLVPAVPLEDYQSMERTVHKLTQAVAYAVAPLKHGRWELKYHKLWGKEFPTCTVCGNPFYATRYCPNCGALMDGSAMEEQQGASNEENTEKSLKGLADKICDLINQPYFSKLAKACNIVVCDLCENADQCKDKPLPPGMQCLGWEPIGGRKK